MKHYKNSGNFNYDKYRNQEWKREHNGGGFRCSHCKQFVTINDMMGTANRNHCNWCLWSKHVDDIKGDRRSTCHGGMKPIGLSFKHEGYNRIGEIMIIHLCSNYQKISINRIARDDPEHKIQDIYYASLSLANPIKSRLLRDNIYLVCKDDIEVLSAQLFGS